MYVWPLRLEAEEEKQTAVEEAMAKAAEALKAAESKAEEEKRVAVLTAVEKAEAKAAEAAKAAAKSSAVEQHLALDPQAVALTPTSASTLSATEAMLP